MIKSNVVGIAVLAGIVAATAGCNKADSGTSSTSTTTAASGAAPMAAGDKGPALTGATSTTDLANKVDTSLKGKTIALPPGWPWA